MNRLSVALNNGLSGLALASRYTQTISNNVANALTEGYAAREVIPGARVIGAVGLGVAVSGVVRNVDPALLAERRMAEAELGLANTRASFYADMENAIGLPNEAGSLSDRLARLSSAMIEAASRPESDARLQSVVTAAQQVSGKLNSASDAVQQIRMDADQEIERAVEFINTTLLQIDELNLPRSNSSAKAEAALDIADQRQKLIDQLSEYIPVREIQRDNGTVTLFTPGGAILLDGNPVEFGFSRSGVITPHLAVGGALSGLTINGVDIATTADSGKIAGGKLAALFDLRDVQAVSVQAELDAVARNLVERFQDPTVDPTLGVGDAGLFTDGGAAFDPLNEVGLSQRLAVHTAVDPAQGGAVWRLRDGIAAVAQGPTGDATLLNNYASALNQLQTPGSGSITGSVSIAGLAAEMVSGISAKQSSFAAAESFANTRTATLKTAEFENGVDTDQEMQRLLLVEQAYAANARVISTIDELIELLTRI